MRMGTKRHGQSCRLVGRDLPDVASFLMFTFYKGLSMSSRPLLQPEGCNSRDSGFYRVKLTWTPTVKVCYMPCHPRRPRHISIPEDERWSTICLVKCCDVNRASPSIRMSLEYFRKRLLVTCPGNALRDRYLGPL